MAVMTKPVAPGQHEETDTAVERVAVFAAAARPEHLATDIRQLFKPGSMHPCLSENSSRHSMTRQLGFRTRD